MTRAYRTTRRRVIGAAAAAGGLHLLGCSRERDESAFVTDVAQLEQMAVARVLRPRSTEEVVEALHAWRGPVSIGGGRFSMGGQIAADDSLHLDMRSLDRLLALDPQARTVRCEAGMRWRDLLDHIDPHDLSVSIMQSYANFTVGGSLSVNCHGRYVGKGALARSVRALRLVTADGRALELSPQREPTLFGAVIGGYGGLGVVTEVELDLDLNTPLRRRMERVALADYPDYFTSRVAADPQVLMHNADLVPPDFDAPLAISWLRTQSAPTVAQRLLPRDLDYGREQNLIWAASELPGSGWLRRRSQAGELKEKPPVVWRNYEASLDTDALEPRTRAMSTYLLQEYFVPESRFVDFARGMAAILQQAEANVLNVSIRHAPADDTSLLRWAAEPVFCFVLYLKQRNSAAASHRSDAWTRSLIDLALALGGRYYLPYRLAATTEQFRRAYPEARRFAEIKREIDPGGRFRNRMWDRYLA